jgi:hypothetical protein
MYTQLILELAAIQIGNNYMYVLAVKLGLYNKLVAL